MKKRFEVVVAINAYDSVQSGILIDRCGHRVSSNAAASSLSGDKTILRPTITGRLPMLGNGMVYPFFEFSGHSEKMLVGCDSDFDFLHNGSCDYTLEFYADVDVINTANAVNFGSDFMELIYGCVPLGLIENSGIGDIGPDPIYGSRPGFSLFTVFNSIGQSFSLMPTIAREIKNAKLSAIDTMTIAELGMVHSPSSLRHDQAAMLHGVCKNTAIGYTPGLYTALDATDNKLKGGMAHYCIVFVSDKTNSKTTANISASVALKDDPESVERIFVNNEIDSHPGFYIYTNGRLVSFIKHGTLDSVKEIIDTLDGGTLTDEQKKQSRLLYEMIYSQDDNYVDNGEIHFARMKKIRPVIDDNLSFIHYPQTRSTALSIFGGYIGASFIKSALNLVKRKLVSFRISKGLTYSANDSNLEPLLSDVLVPEEPPFFAYNGDSSGKKFAVPESCSIIKVYEKPKLQLLVSELDKSQFTLLRAVVNPNGNEDMWIESILDSDGNDVGFNTIVLGNGNVYPQNFTVIYGVDYTLGIKEKERGRFCVTASFDEDAPGAGQTIGGKFSVMFRSTGGATLLVSFWIDVTGEHSLFYDFSDFGNLAISKDIQVHSIAPTYANISEISSLIDEHYGIQSTIDSISSQDSGRTFYNTFGGATYYTDELQSQISISTNTLSFFPNGEFLSIQKGFGFTDHFVGYLKIEADHIGQIKNKTKAGVYFALNMIVDNYTLFYQSINIIEPANIFLNDQFIAYLISENRHLAISPQDYVHVDSLNGTVFTPSTYQYETYIPLNNFDVVGIVTKDDSSTESGDLTYFPCHSRRVGPANVKTEYTLYNAGIVSNVGEVTILATSTSIPVGAITWCASSFKFEQQDGFVAGVFDYRGLIGETSIVMPGSPFGGVGIVGYDSVKISLVVGVLDTQTTSMTIISDGSDTALRIGITGLGFPYVFLATMIDEDDYYLESLIPVKRNEPCKIDVVIDGGKELWISVDGIVSGSVSFVSKPVPQRLDAITIKDSAAEVFLVTTELSMFHHKKIHLEPDTEWLQAVTKGQSVFPEKSGIVSTPKSSNVKVQIQPVFGGALCDVGISGIAWVGSDGTVFSEDTWRGVLELDGTRMLTGTLPLGTFAVSQFTIDMQIKFSALTNCCLFRRRPSADVYPVGLSMLSSGNLGIQLFWPTCPGGTAVSVATESLGLIVNQLYSIALVCRRVGSTTEFIVYVDGARVLSHLVNSIVGLNDLHSEAFTVFGTGTGGVVNEAASGTVTFFRIVVGEDLYANEPPAGGFSTLALPLPSTNKIGATLTHYCRHTSVFNLLDCFEYEVKSPTVFSVNGIVLGEDPVSVEFSNGGTGTFNKNNVTFSFSDSGDVSALGDGDSLETAAIISVTVMGEKITIYMSIYCIYEPIGTTYGITSNDIEFEYDEAAITGNILSGCSNVSCNRDIVVKSINGLTISEIENINGSNGGVFVVAKNGLFVFSGTEDLEGQTETSITVIATNGVADSDAFTINIAIAGSGPQVTLATYSDAQFSWGTPQTGLNVDYYNAGCYIFSSYQTDFLSNPMMTNGNRNIIGYEPGGHGVDVKALKVDGGYYITDPVTMAHPENQPFTIQALCGVEDYTAMVCGNHDGSNGFGISFGFGGSIIFTRKSSSGTYTVSTPTGVIVFDYRMYVIEVSVDGNGICRIFVNGTKHVEAAIQNGATSTAYSEYSRGNTIYIGYTGYPSYYGQVKSQYSRIALLNVINGPNVMHVDSHTCPTPSELCPGQNWPGFTENFIG